MKACFRECLLHVSKRFNGALKVAIRLDDNGNSTLNVHRTNVSLSIANVNGYMEKAAIHPYG